MNIFQKAGFITALLVGQVAVATAQQAVSAEWGRGDEYNVKLNFINNLHVPIIIRITFQNPNSFGGSVPSPYTTSMSARGRISITLPRKEGADYAYSYKYWWGCRNPKIEEDYPYLIPIGNNKETNVGRLFLFNERYKMREKVPAKNFYATTFSASKGDTVYAARRGTVFNIKDDANLKHGNYSMSTEDNQMYIIHKDCSYARYNVLSEILVKEGQRVEAGEPIAIVGGDKYARSNHVRFSVMYSYFCDSCENRKGAYGNSYLKPKFYLSHGNVDTLWRCDNTYTAIHPEEIITREMSRRELKKWKKAHPITSKPVAVTGSHKNESEVASSSISTISAVVAKGNNYNNTIAVVKLLVNGVEVAKGDYRNGGFSISLPESIGNELKPFASRIPSMYRVSNRNTQLAEADLVAYNKNDEQVGKFSYRCYEPTTSEEKNGVAYKAGISYFDSDVIITGSEKRGAGGGYKSISINLNIKKGWNFIYSSGINKNTEGGYTLKITTAEPNNMQWFFSSERH